ncbi:MAG: TonB-dependent receptor [Proteobacteria bacterium]|nr:TonB-dependent receptor [Pseudomonadota bacterium]
MKCFGVAALAAMLSSSDLMAQTAADSPAADSSALAEVVVSVQRRSESLQHVPVAVEAFTAEQLHTSVMTTVTDLGAVTPGLIPTAQFGYFQPHLRGIGTTAPSASVENPVAVYVDGIYYGSQGASIFSLEGIDHIEVDKGPQGTLFGRNATGGLIQIVTRDPDQAFGGSASLTGGNYGTFGGSAYVTGGLTSQLASNLSVYFQNQSTGFGRNAFTGLGVNKAEDFAIRVKNKFTPTDVDVIMLTADYEQDHSSPVLIPAPGTTPVGGVPYTGSPWSADGYYQPLVDEKEGAVSLKISHDFGGASLESTSAYLQSRLYSALDGTFVTDPNFALNIILWDLNRQVTQEFDLRSAPGSSITWTTGVYFYQATAEYSPIYLEGGYINPLTNFYTYSRAKNYSLAAFGQATKELFAGTNLTLGVRETYEDKKFSNLQSGLYPDNSLVIFGTGAAHQSSNEPTWRISLDRQMTPDILLYVSYNRGYKTGGYNDEYLPVAPYKPETLDAFEIGAKSDLLDHHLRFDLAAFYYNYRNLQTVGYPAGTELVYSAPRAYISGVDIDFQFAPVKNFTVSGGVEILRANYADFPGAQLSEPAPGGGSILSTFDAHGNRLPLAAKWTANISPVYTIPLADKGTATLAATYSYNSGFFYEPDNRFRQGGYPLLNASATWTSATDAYSARVWGKNLTQKAYTTAMYAQGNADYAQYAAPRTFGLTVTRKF